MHKFLYWLAGVSTLATLAGGLTCLLYWKPILFGVLALVVMAAVLKDTFVCMGEDVVDLVRRVFNGKKGK